MSSIDSNDLDLCKHVRWQVAGLRDRGIKGERALTDITIRPKKNWIAPSLPTFPFALMARRTSPSTNRTPYRANCQWLALAKVYDVEYTAEFHPSG